MANQSKKIKATKQEIQDIRYYMAMEASDETVESLYKVRSELISPNRFDIWDVKTNKEEWWVITLPTNLYSKKMFPEMDMALTFHIGLGVRLFARN